VATIPVGREPQAVAPCPSQAGNTLCVPLAGDDALAVVDPDNRRVVATIPVGHRPTGVGVAPAGSGILGSNPNDSEIYVANSASDSVSVISAQLRRVIATIAVPGGPVSVVVPGTGGGVAYVGTRAGSVVALSLANHVVLGTLLPAGAGPVGQMDYDAVTGQIYAPRPADGAVAVLRPASDTGAGANAPMPAEPVRTLPFPGGPAAVAITFDGALGFVVERDTGRVAMLDVAAHRTLTTIDVGGAPRGVITGAYPPLLGRQQANVIGFVILGALIVVLLIGFISIERHSRRAARERQQKQQQQADAERPRAQPPGGTA